MWRFELVYGPTARSRSFAPCNPQLLLLFVLVYDLSPCLGLMLARRSLLRAETRTRNHTYVRLGYSQTVSRSFLGFDIRRSPLVPCVSSTLLLLLGILAAP